MNVPLCPQHVDVDRPSGEFTRAQTSERGLDVAREPFESGTVERRFEFGRNVEKRRTFSTVRRLAFVKRRNRPNLRAGTQTLQRSQNIRLPVAQVRSDSDKDLH